MRKVLTQVVKLDGKTVDLSALCDDMGEKSEAEPILLLLENFPLWHPLQKGELLWVETQTNSYGKEYVTNIIEKACECRYLFEKSTDLDGIADFLSKSPLTNIVTDKIYLNFHDESKEEKWLCLRRSYLKLGSSNNNEYRLDQARADAVDQYSIPQNYICSCYVNGTNIGVLYPGKNLLPEKSQNIQSGETLLSGLLKKFRKIDPEAAKALEVTNTLYKEYCNKLFQISEKEEHKLKNTRRIASILEAAKKNKDYIDDFVEIFHEHYLKEYNIEDWLKEEKEKRLKVLEGKMEEERKKRELEMDKTREEGFAKIHEEQSQFKNELSRLKKEKDSAQKELDALRSEKKALIRERQQELAVFGEKLRSMTDKALETLAESSLFHALLPSENNVSRKKSSPELIPFPPQHHNAEPITEREILHEIFSQNSKGQNLEKDILLRMVGYMGMRQLPVLWGNQSWAAIHTLAASLCGGSVFWYPISAATYRTQDLLEQTTLYGGDAPVPSDLSRILYSAADNHNKERLLLVVLEGINRSPLEAYLPLLLAAYRDEAIRLPLGYGNGISWPKNVLLAASLVDGKSSFRIPRFLLEDLKLFWVSSGQRISASEQNRYGAFSSGKWEDIVDFLSKGNPEAQIKYLQTRLNINLPLEEKYEGELLHFIWNGE